MPYRYAVYAARPCLANEERCWMNIRTKKLNEAARNHARFWFVCAINGDKRIFSAPAAELEKAFHEHAVNVLDKGSTSEKYSLYTDHRKGEIFSAVTQSDTDIVFSLMKEPQGDPPMAKESSAEGETVPAWVGGPEPVYYDDLSDKGKEAYNVQKLMSLLADYGFECQRVTNDAWCADVIACLDSSRLDYRGRVMLLQIKGRPAVEREAVRKQKNLYIAFPDPAKRGWYIIPDNGTAESIVPEKSLVSDSWERGIYHVRKLTDALERQLSPYLFPWVSEERSVL